MAQPARSATNNTVASRPSKRAKPGRPAIVTLEGALSEEILLLCLSFLEVDDLLALALVSSSWNRLSQDPDSVLAEAPIDLTIAGEAADEPQAALAHAPRPPPPAPTPRATLNTILAFHKSFYLTASRKAVSATPAVSVFSTTPAGASVLVGSVSSPSLQQHYSLQPHSKSTLAITELRLDDRPAGANDELSLRLAVWYSTGHFALFHILLPTPSTPFSSVELYSSIPLSNVPHLLTSPPLANDPVVLARFHSPLLVTCSASFNIRFWRVIPVLTDAGSPQKVIVEESRPGFKSRESWWPVVLTLAPCVAPSEVDVDSEDGQDEWERSFPEPRVDKAVDEVFKCTFAYSTPVFPSAWSVGVQEFIVNAPSLSPFPLHSHSHSTPRHPRMTISARHATAPRAHSIGALNPRQRWNPSHDDGLVTSIEHAEPWIVTSRADNTIDVYEVVDHADARDAPRSTGTANTIRTSSVLSSTLSVVHRRTLFGHTASVSSVAVNEQGRCVSGGVDGRVRVWDVGAKKGSGLAVTEKNGSEGDEDDDGDDALSWEDIRTGASGRSRPGNRIKRLFFDEEKIVSIVEDGEDTLRNGAEESVRVLRFD
ncbi:hypothetical protein RQP46_008416 [Phenoliferia psychrophenolica]